MYPNQHITAICYGAWAILKKSHARAISIGKNKFCFTLYLTVSYSP